MIIDVIP